MKINELNESPFDINHLIEFLCDVNELFNPPLRTRILNKAGVASFEEYLLKVSKFGHILIQYNQIEIQGVTMFYANDEKEGKAYIALVAVRKAYHNQGVGKGLTKKTIETIARYKMKTITVKTWKDNTGAINLYQKLGFLISEIRNSDVVLKFFINS